MIDNEFSYMNESILARTPSVLKCADHEISATELTIFSAGLELCCQNEMDRFADSVHLFTTKLTSLNLTGRKEGRKGGRINNFCSCLAVLTSIHRPSQISYNVRPKECFSSHRSTFFQTRKTASHKIGSLLRPLASDFCV